MNVVQVLLLSLCFVLQFKLHIVKFKHFVVIAVALTHMIHISVVIFFYDLHVTVLLEFFLVMHQFYLINYNDMNSIV